MYKIVFLLETRGYLRSEYLLYWLWNQFYLNKAGQTLLVLMWKTILQVLKMFQIHNTAKKSFSSVIKIETKKIEMHNSESLFPSTVFLPAYEVTKATW